MGRSSMFKCSGDGDPQILLAVPFGIKSMCD